MHLSHSGLQQILSCPASYFLSKKQGIFQKSETKALQIGSAFHWGCEHNTSDLSGYLKELDLYQLDKYDFNKDVVIAEGMVHGYLQHREELFQEILKDGDDYLHILDEQHELDLTVELPSYRFDKPHEFHGIIDLLLLTEKGFIILDYKTSSMTPDWDKYLDQVIRYCWMVKQVFPDVPICKVGIINVKKISLRPKTNENEENFLRRIKNEYMLNDTGLITYHEFGPETFTEDKMNLYIDNLSRMADFAQVIEDNNLWFINYGNATSVYGKSEYWNLFYRTPDYQYLYKIADEMYNEDYNEVTKFRDCVQLDLDALDETLRGRRVLNHYTDFAAILEKFESEGACPDPNEINNYINGNYLTDDTLLEKYWFEYIRRKELNEEVS